MVYVSNGQVLDSRAQSPWRLSLLVDLFWGAVEFIGLFFKTMFHPDMSKNGSSVSSRFTDGRGTNLYHLFLTFLSTVGYTVLQVHLVAEGGWEE
uniref:Selenoprotein K n=1 Tax=Astatotilapia calliptera TaxID=8154 RepID=A0A3P8QJP6_ASTCA